MPLRKAASKVVPAAPEMQCTFCNKVFQREGMFAKHECEKKKRDLMKNERFARTALTLFVKYFQYNHNAKKQKTWIDLVQSKFFDNFITAGRYIEENDLVNPMQFADFVIRHQVRVIDWPSPSTYSVYIQDLLDRESIDTAGKRVETLAAKWAETNGLPAEEFFKFLNKNQGIMWISTGRISPWAAFIFPSFGKFLDGMSNEQLVLVERHLQLDRWSKKAALNNDEVNRLLDHYKGLGY